jgi:HEPN domain-containing protein
MPDRSQDWLRQAERDLEQASDSHHSARFEWSCFAAHQAAEKAIKALHLHSGQEAWGHGLAKIIRELPVEVSAPEDFLDMAHILDGYYIPSRYPNGHTEGAPFEHYGRKQSEEAVSYARTIIEFVRAQMAKR